jgi:4-oxalocrotonate tautomerase
MRETAKPDICSILRSHARGGRRHYRRIGAVSGRPPRPARRPAHRSGLSRCTHGRPEPDFAEEAFMPLIQVRVIEGVFTEAQKRQVVHELTDAMVSVEGENMRPVTWVIVEEVKSGDWGIGGKTLTTADVRALAAGTPTG